MGTVTKQQKNVPGLRFSEFNGLLNSKSLRTVANSVDYRGKAPLKSDSGIFLVTAKNIKKGYIDYECSKEYVLKSDYSEVMRKGLPEIGDVLFTTEAPLGNVAQVDNKDIALAQRVIKFRGKEILDNTFLKFYFLSSEFSKRIARVAIGSTVQGISGSDLHKTIINFPDLQEQQKIADFLGSVDAWLDNLRQQKTALETYKRGMMQKLFTQQVRFKDEDGKDFPEWQENKLGQLEDIKAIKLGRGNVISKQDIADKPGDHPIYSSSVKENGLFGSYADYMFDEELLTWSVDGGGHFFYRPKHKFSVTNVSGWMRILSKDIVPKFLAYQLQFHHAKLVFDYSSKAHPSVIRGVYTVALPAFEEQQKIANFLSAIDQTVTAKAEEITKVEQWKKGLMQKMFV